MFTRSLSMSYERLPDSSLERRTFLGLTAGLASGTALPVSGCLNSGGELGYRNWMPASFDPSGMYIDVPVVRDNTQLFASAGDSTGYGFGFDDITEIVGTSDAEVIKTGPDASAEVSGDEVAEYGGFTIYDPSGPGYVGSDGDTVIESRQRYAITSVVDAQAGNLPRLHEENSSFAAVTSEAGDADLVVVPSPSARTADAGLEAKAARFREDGVDVRFVVELDDVGTETVRDTVDSVEGVSVTDSREGGSDGLVVMSLEVEEGRLLEFFDLAATT